MSFESWLSSQKLNEQQLLAVLAPGDLAIRAAAGSGKTKTLVCRILSLLDRLRGSSTDIGGDLINRASLSRIAATTFTRKAAGEMRERLHQYLEELIQHDPENQSFWNERLHELPSAFIGTIDSLAGAMVRQLNRAGCPSPLGSDFTMLDDLDRDSLIEEAIRLTRVHFANLESQKQGIQANAWILWETEDGRSHVIDGIHDVLARGTDCALLRPDPNGGPLSVAMIEVIQFAEAQYLELCRTEGQFDFAQVSRELLRLLQANPEPRNRISSHFEHLLVDEFQDTNDQQWQILTALAGQPGQGRLTVVGDPQQSIYMFRGADPGVFERTWELFDIPDCQRIILDRNYRTLAPRPMGAMNHLSRIAFGNKLGGENTFFELRPGIESDRFGNVGLILEDNEELWCDRVARELLKRSQSSWYDHRSKKEKPLRFRDMAILLRSRARLEAVQSALDRWNIPYEVPGGIGFWQTQEIRDVINLIRALADESDDLSTAGVMRGPIGRLGDSLILAIIKEKSGSLSQKLERIYQGKLTNKDLKAPTEAWQSLVSFATHWVDWRHHADRMPHVDLVLRALKQSGAWHFFAGVEHGRRCVANLDKLIGHLHEWGQTHPGSMAQLARRIEKVAQETTRTEQADPSDQQDAVQIMTIHAAKGLEHPVVVLGDIQNQGSNSAPRCMVLDRYLHFSRPDLPEAIELHSCLVRKDSPTMDNLQERIEAGKIGELARLFYVGLTRAQDTLILAGTHKPQGKPPKNSFFFWVTEALNLDPSEALDRQSFAVSPEEFEGITLWSDTAPVDPFHRPVVVGSPWIANEVRVFPQNPTLAMSHLEEYAELWNKDRNLWRMKFVHFVQPHLAPEIPGQGFQEATSDAQAPGKRIGSLVHRALELEVSPIGLSPEEGIELLTAIQMGMVEPDEDPSVAEDVARQTWELFQKIQRLNNPEILSLVTRPGQSEVDLVLPLGRWRLSGRLDKLFTDEEDGGLSFVDWKTDHQPPDKIVEKYETAMGLYALALAKTTRKPPQQVTGRLVCLRHGAVRKLVFDPARLAELEARWTGLLNEWLEDREGPSREKGTKSSKTPKSKTVKKPSKKQHREN